MTSGSTAFTFATSSRINAASPEFPSLVASKVYFVPDGSRTATMKIRSRSGFKPVVSRSNSIRRRLSNERSLKYVRPVATR